MDYGSGAKAMCQVQKADMEHGIRFQWKDGIAASAEIIEDSVLQTQPTVLSAVSRIPLIPVFEPYSCGWRLCD